MIRRTVSNLQRYRASERHVLFMPPEWERTAAGARKPLVIWLAGHGADATQAITAPYVDHVLYALADAGYPVMAIDAGYPAASGGQKGWGNATVMTAIAAAKTWAQATTPGALAAPAGKVVVGGVSLGSLNAAIFALLNPTLVSCLPLLIPAFSLKNFHDNNQNGYAASEIETAYGLAAGAALNTAMAARDPDQNRSGFAGIPIKAWIADADTAAPFALSQAFVDAVPSASRASLGAVNHDPTPTPAADVVAFVNANV